MLLPIQFAVPTKVHFLSPKGGDVATIYVDCVIPQAQCTKFYFGNVCVATLDETCLMIGPIKVERKLLMNSTPFRYDSSATEVRYAYPLCAG